jgi:ribosomal protein S12 methylthiotransferase accessory factor
MGTTGELVIRLAGNRRIEAGVGAHTVRTDQPPEMGGEGSAPSPFDLFLASIGTCAGVFVQGFCAKRGIPFEEIVLRERVTYGEDGVLASVDLEIQLPETFPEKYRDAVVKVAEQCSVKRAIHAQPLFRVSAAPPGEAHVQAP